MSLHPEALPPVPESTPALARTVLRNENRYMTIRDELGVFFKADLPRSGLTLAHCAYLSFHLNEEGPLRLPPHRSYLRHPA
jgi:hypothetical protein